MKKLCLFICCVFFLFFCLNAFAEPSVREILIQNEKNRISYPMLDGAEQSVLTKVNDDLVLNSGIASCLSSYSSPGGSANVSYKVAFLSDRLFSVEIINSGKRGTVSEYAVSYDLSDGSRLQAERLFDNLEDAVSLMISLAETSLEKEMTEYAEFSGLEPFPINSFTVDRAGIMFVFPSDQWKLLNGQCGVLQFRWEELTEVLSEKAMLDYFQIVPEDAIQSDLVRQIIENGKIPGLAVSLGMRITELDECYSLARTPDSFPGGRYCVFSAPEFREMYVITDQLYEDLSESVCEGLQMKRGGFAGLRIGTTQRSQWIVAMGEPDDSVILTENMAYDYQLPSGSYDCYSFGGNSLRLYSDDEGLLSAIQINKNVEAIR